MSRTELTEIDPISATVLRNRSCPYCGTALSTDNQTKEHVVGRRFVPKGKFEASWNLILNSCGDCNQEKADLEDDLSAITMQPHSGGEYAAEDEVLKKEAVRKRGSISRRTGKRVGESQERLEISGQVLPGVKMTFSAVAQPQPDERRAFLLARMQLSGFFYWITYDSDRKKGGFWLGDFFPLQAAFQADWGNPVQSAFMASVREWEPRVIGGIADGFFQVALRRHPSAVCWSWAMEWNQNYRLVGFLGEREPVEAVVESYPRLEPTIIGRGGRNSGVAIREEESLAAEEDVMFAWIEDS